MADFSSPTPTTMAPTPSSFNLQRLALRHQPLTTLVMATVLFVFFGGILSFLLIGKVQSYIQTRGTVAAFSPTVTYTAETRGTLEKIHVKPKDLVSIGEELITLRNPDSADTEGILSLERDLIHLELRRLQAQLDGKEVLYSAEERRQYPDIVADHEKIVAAWLSAQRTKATMAQEKIAQKMARWETLTQEAIAVEQSFGTAFTPLMEKWKITQTQWNSLSPDRREAFLQNQLKQANARANEALASLSEEQLEFSLYQDETQKSLMQAMGQQRERLTSVTRELDDYRAHQKQFVLAAQSNGIIEDVLLGTPSVGKHIDAGTPLVVVRPLSQEQNITALIRQSDLQTLREGQPVTVVVPLGENGQKYLDGRLDYISSTVEFLDQDLEPVYKVSVRANSKMYAENNKEYLLLSPSQSVTLYFHRPEKRVASAMFDFIRGRFPMGKNSVIELRIAGARQS